MIEYRWQKEFTQEQLQKLFDNFPAAPELIDRFENSYWIKISKKEDLDGTRHKSRYKRKFYKKTG